MSVDIKRLTAHLSPQQQAAVKKAYRARAENSTAAFISCFFLGIFGAHRFYLKQWRQAFLHLLLAVAIVLAVVGGFLLNQPVASAIIAGILLLLALLWVIVDLVHIDDEVAGHNLKLAEMLIAQTLLADHTVEQKADATLQSLLRETAAQADAAANYGRMQMDDHTGAPSPNDTAAAAPVPAVGAVTAQYDATTVTQISDDPNATQSGSKQSPETEQQATPHTESSVETDTVSDMPAEAALAGTSLAPLVSQVVTHTHEVSGYSVTDGVETISTASIPEPPQADASAPTAIDPNLLPTSEEANAATWPSYSAASLDASQASGHWIAPDVTDRGDIGGDVKPVADIDPIGVLPLHVALDDTTGVHPAVDAATDTGLGVAAAAAAAPFVAAQPASPATAETPAEPSAFAVEPAPAVAAPADEGLLFLVPDEAPAASLSMETPAAAYIPPVVPLVSTPEADIPPAAAEYAAEPEPAPHADPFVAAGTVPAAYEAALAPAPVAYEPPHAVEPQPEPEPQSEPEPEEHTHSGVETLAELASFAGLAGLATSAADEAVSLARAHRESLAAAEAASAAPEPPAEPAYDATPAEHSTAPQPETLAELAASPAPATQATPEPAPAEPAAEAMPAAQPEEEMATAPELEAVPVAATAAALAAATDAELLTHHKLKRIRVVRQLKVDGKVIEETSAEEYVDPDVDPAPVKARLREQLRQRAQQRTNTQGETNG